MAVKREIADVAVVIPTHRRPELLRQCLRALDHQECLPAEVIVVNDASRDATRDVVLTAQRSLNLRLSYLELERNRGPAAARNTGISAASTRFIAFTDDDCEPEPAWLRALVTAAQSHPEAVGVGGRVIAGTRGLVSRYMICHRVLEPPSNRAYLVTCNCIYRRDALIEVGGFNERVRWPGGEDPGLSFRLRAHGYSFAYTPDAVVRHHFRDGLGNFFRTFFNYGRGGRVVVDA